MWFVYAVGGFGWRCCFLSGVVEVIDRMTERTDGWMVRLVIAL